MKFVSAIIFTIVALASIASAAEGSCTSADFGTVEEGETAYAACAITHDGYKSALCMNGTYGEPNEEHCTLRVMTVFSYGIDSLIYTVGEVIADLIISTDGVLSTFTSNPVLPAGLVLDSDSGKIHGTPTAAALGNVYVISATGTEQTISLTITVNAVFCPALDKFPLTLNGETASSTESCPNGMEGTSTRLCTNGFFGAINIDNCVPKGPENFFYNPSSISTKRLTSAGVMTPTFENTVVSFTINPQLPTGLKLSGKGTISGVPTVLVNSQQYTVTAVGLGGKTKTTVVSITVTPASCTGLQNENGMSVVTQHNLQLSSSKWCPEFTKGAASYTCLDGVYSPLSTLGCMIMKPTSFSYAKSNFMIYKGDSIDTGKPTFIGRAVKFDTNNVALENGLTLDAETGVLSGTPEANGLNSIEITIYARPEMNSITGNSASTRIQINIIPAMCPKTGDFKETSAGGSATFKCDKIEGYEGDMKRACKKEGNRAMWAAPEGYCQKKQDFTFFYISIIIFVICLIVLIVGISIKSSRSRSKNVKSLKTTPKTGSNKAPAVKAPATAPKPKSAKVTI